LGEQRRGDSTGKKGRSQAKEMKEEDKGKREGLIFIAPSPNYFLLFPSAAVVMNVAVEQRRALKAENSDMGHGEPQRVFYSLSPF